MFGRNMRLVTRCEWLTFLPADGLLPHTVQTFDILTTSFRAAVVPIDPSAA
jgi:hypothetical protein